MDITQIIEQMDKLFPDAKTELEYSTAFQFVVAVILSAQSTDKQVNKVTAHLFEKIKNPKDVLDMWEEWLKQGIKSIGFFNMKAKNIFKLAGILNENNDKIPDDLEELKRLPWIWLKTAKLVLNQIYGKNYIPVDTHVQRISTRLWLTNFAQPEKTSELLEQIIPEKYKAKAHHSMIFFGRYFCTAKNPKCLTSGECPFIWFCKYYNSLKK